MPPLQHYDIYRPRTRLLERRILYGLLGFGDEWDTLPPQGEWARAYRKVDTVHASTPAQALLGSVLDKIFSRLDAAVSLCKP